MLDCEKETLVFVPTGFRHHIKVVFNHAQKHVFLGLIEQALKKLPHLSKNIITTEDQYKLQR